MFTESIRQHGSKHHAKESWGEDAVLLHAVCHWEGIRLVSVIEYVCHHSVVELSDNCDELVWAPKLSHNLPQTVSADCVKCLCQINEGYEEVTVLL